jgi:hypothetical protein
MSRWIPSTHHLLILIMICPGFNTREERSVGFFDQVKISQRSEADVRSENGPVHRDTRREHPRFARKALLVLDARETFKVKGQAGTLWRMVLTTWASLCSNLGLVSTLPNFCRNFSFSVLCGRHRAQGDAVNLVTVSISARPPKQPRMVRTFFKVHTRPRLAHALRCRGY